MHVSPRPYTRHNCIWGKYNPSSETQVLAGRAITSALVWRLVQSGRGEREHLDAIVGDANGMFELRRQGSITRDRGPSVGQYFHVRAAEIDHRFDGEEHSRLEHDALAWATDVHDVRLVMEQAAKAVPAEITHHAHVLRLDVGLDGVSDITARRAGLDCGDTAHHRLVRYVNQTLGAPRNLADRKHAAGIAVPAIQDQRHIDVDDVSFLQR